MDRQEISSARTGLTGLLVRPQAEAGAGALLVCVHGGGCNGLYFDIKGHSTAAAAAERGMPALLVNRPGHGGAAAPRTGSPIAEAAALTRELVDEVRTDLGIADRPVVMIGHSIGGAVALTLAAGRGDWPLRAVAVSGIGDRPSAEAKAWFAGLGEGGAGPEPPADFFFGPEGSYGWQGPAALRRASEPWREDEVVETLGAWPGRFAEVAKAVDVPVHFRLAEHERIWETGSGSLARIAARFARAPAVDAAVLPHGGHLYEIHRNGPELIAAQLGFLQAAVASQAPK